MMSTRRNVIVNSDVAVFTCPTLSGHPNIRHVEQLLFWCAPYLIYLNQSIRPDYHARDEKIMDESNSYVH